MRIVEDTTIETNRGDKLLFKFSIPLEEEKIVEGTGGMDDIIVPTKYYEFQVGDVLTFGVYRKKKYEKEALLLKDFEITEKTTEVIMEFSSDEMKIGDLIEKPTDYWYEIQLNREYTVLGYNQDGAKIIRLYPEGSDIPMTFEEVVEV